MRKHSSALTVLGFAPILSCILLNAYYYFDLSFEMNTPVKMTLQVSLILIMLCYTGELRFLLGRSLPQLYLILHGWAQAVGALCAVSVPIAFVFDRFHRVDYAAGALLIFTVLLTQQGQASRLLSQDTTEKAVPPSSTNFNMADDARESEEPKS